MDPESVTALVGIRNRGGSRMINCLQSLRRQVYPQHLLKILVVDFGSSPEESNAAHEICNRVGAAYHYVPTDSIWNRSRCLNIGLKLVDTKYLLVSDIDLVFSPNYVAESLALVTQAPLTFAIGPMFDLPESSSYLLNEFADKDLSIPIELLDQLAVGRFVTAHRSIVFARSDFFRAIGGYDEEFSGWGSEDDDLFFRLIQEGLIPVSVSRARYYHQWHAKYAGIESQDLQKTMIANKALLRKKHRRFL